MIKLRMKDHHFTWVWVFFAVTRQEKKKTWLSKASLLELIFLISWTLCLNSCGYKWEKTSSRNTRDWGFSVQQTNDGGYIIAGTTWPAGVGDVYLIKADISGNRVWSTRFGGPDVDWGFSVEQTTDGGYIIAGTTWPSGERYSDVYLIKTDAMGNKLWSKTLGGRKRDWGYSVQQTLDGGYIVVGKTDSTGAGNDDVYLIKADGNGNRVWSKTFGGPGEDWGYSVRQTADGGYIIVGKTDSFGAGGGDIYLIKTDANGNQIWSRVLGGPGQDWAKSVQQTADGGYIIAGTTWRSGASDLYLVKTDLSGNEIWSRTFGGPYGDYGHSVQQTTSGDYIVTGYTRPFGDSGGSDVYLVKTDGDGNLAWSRTYGGDWFDYGNAVQQTADGGYVIVGETTSFGNKDKEDIYLIKTNDSGDVLWSKTFGG